MPLARNWLLLARLVALAILPALPVAAQAPEGGSVSGVVTKADDQAPLAGVQVRVKGLDRLSTVTGTDGRYTLRRVPAGTVTLVFRWVGFQPEEKSVTVADGQQQTVDVALASAPLALGELVVTGVSLAPERIVEAPAAVSVVDPQVLQANSVTGQAPLALSNIPGVDLAQNGVNDFNVNARGFNSSLNRRILTLLDGRDLAIAFLGSQEWASLPVPMEDLQKIEMVRGPGSALYGNNAFSGVLNMRTPLVRDSKGGRLSIGGGELNTVRSDARYSYLSASQRWGVRFAGGYNVSDTWTRSRTAPTDFRNEYAGIGGGAGIPALGAEVRPLDGQVTAGLGQPATGDRDLIRNWYATTRFDYYAGDNVLTLEGGLSHVENEVFVTGIGRVQVPRAIKPFTRVAWNSKRLNLMAYWNGRNSLDPQVSLASGAGLEEKSNIFHVEAQSNLEFAGTRGRVIYGTSYRRTMVNTSGTLMRPVNDDRSDWIASGFAQLEYRLTDQVKLVGASRVDGGNLFDTQLSPKAALVYSPSEDHSIHASVNRAFMTPNYSEFFLSAAAGAPVNLSALEAGLRANAALGPALAGVPNGALFTTSAAVPVRAEGNANLRPEETVGFEIGYKGNIGKSAYVTADFYTSRLRNFVTDLLPGINPAFQPWTAPTAVPEVARAQLETAVRGQLLALSPLAGQGLTRLPDNGATAIVVSYGNAGEVVQRGIELGGGYQFTDEFRLDGTFTLFDFTVKSQAQGDQLLPNTPARKGTLSATYTGVRNGLDVNVSARLVGGFPWAAGVFVGNVPSQEMVNVTAGYRFSNSLRASLTATNVFDQQRFSIFGGAVIGRRILGMITTTF
ncbi:MAG: TonB-dependent receptor [Gemmatimonadales bacterium]|nr:TonB-dependent receptor [Gemmatimonadales bacterium]